MTKQVLKEKIVDRAWLVCDNLKSVSGRAKDLVAFITDHVAEEDMSEELKTLIETLDDLANFDLFDACYNYDYDEEEK